MTKIDNMALNDLLDGLEEAAAIRSDLAPKYRAVIEGRIAQLKSALAEPQDRYWRPAVEVFANNMERKLREHDDRPGWEGEPTDYLWSRLLEELFELRQAVESRNTEAIIDECADAANFLMMLADRAQSGAFR